MAHKGPDQTNAPQPLQGLVVQMDEEKMPLDLLLPHLHPTNDGTNDPSAFTEHSIHGKDCLHGKLTILSVAG